jgi:hypothetical protein
LLTILLHFNATRWWVIARLADTSARPLQLAALSANVAMQHCTDEGDSSAAGRLFAADAVEAGEGTLHAC